MRKLAYAFYAFVWATSAYGGSSGTYVDNDGLSNDMTIIETADMPTKAKVWPKLEPVIKPFTWNGFYIGGSVGAINLSNTGTVNPTDALSQAAIQAGDVPSGASFNKTNLIYGALVGFNRQIGWSLWGVEGEYSGTQINNLFATTAQGSACTLSSSISGGFFGTLSTTQCGGTTTTSFQEKLDAYAAIRFKWGVAIDRWLVYAAGGPAFGNFSFNAGGQCTAVIPGLVCPTFAGNEKDWIPGYTVGGGIEYAWGQLVVGAEGFYYNFGSRNISVIPSLPISTGDIINTGNLSGWVTRLRVTWLINDWTLFTP